MRYEGSTLNITVQFQRDPGLPLFWTGLQIKYRLFFEDDTYISIENWMNPTYVYKGDTAYASFNIELTKFLPLKSIQIWGKRPKDNDESDIKEKTYIFSETTVLAKLEFNDKDNLKITEYSPFYKNTIKPSRTGSLEGFPKFQGTSQETKVRLESWHEGYIAIYPTKVKYLGELRFPKITIGLASSEHTESGVFMKNELANFTPTEEKWYYFKLPDNFKEQNLTYPMIIYKIGEYQANLYHNKISKTTIAHISHTYYTIRKDQVLGQLQSIVDIEEEEIVNSEGKKIKNYGITSMPSLSGFFKLPDGEFPYKFNSGELTFSVVSKLSQGEEIIEDGGILFYNKNLNSLQIQQEPLFKKTKIWIYPKENDNGELEPKYRQKYCFINTKAINLFSNQEEDFLFSYDFTENYNPIIFPETLEIFTSLQNEKEEELIEDIDNPILYNKDLVFSQEEFILNPYEKISYRINSNYIYFPDQYSFNYNEDYLTCKLYEQVLENEKDEFSFAEEYSFTGFIYPQEDKKILYQNKDANSLSYFKSYDEYTSNFERQTINSIDEESTIEVKSLLNSLFVKLGFKITWWVQKTNTFHSTDIIEIKTLRLGRVLPFTFEEGKQTFSTKKITYSLEDYGGDKTINKNFNTGVNSLKRSGEERVRLSLRKENEEIAFLWLKKDMFTEKTLSTIFLEKIKREIFLTPDSLSFNADYSEEILMEVNNIVGEYYFGYKGINNYQFFKFTINDIVIMQSNNPVVSYRKGGIIINGEPGEKLAPIEENGKQVGSYFIKINALTTKDRIILQFPGGAQGEIYYRPADSSQNIEEKIVLKGFVLE